MEFKDILPGSEKLKEDLPKTDLREKTKDELKRKIRQLENQIHDKGVGSDYLRRAERIQRDVNLALVLGTAATVVGIAAWSLYKTRGND
jgi:hypothetical protein